MADGPNYRGQYSPSVFGGGGGGGTPIAVGPTPPSSPIVDELWVDTADAAQITVGTTPPASPISNQLWVDTN